jgi:hypothetical protein
MKTVALFFILILTLGSNPNETVAQSFLPMYEAGRLTLVEDAVYGSEYDEDESVLYGPSAVCVDDAGDVFVLDFKLYCIKKYNAEGELLMTFSRQGEGPGELGRAYDMAMTADGNLVVFDSDNHRLTVFDRDGEYVDSRGFQGYGTGLLASQDGSVYVRVSVFTEHWQEKGSLFRIVRLSPDLADETVVDSAYVKTSQIVQATDNSMTSVGIPFVAIPEFAISPGGEIIIGRGNEYELKILSPELEPIREIRRDVDRVKVTDEDKEAYFENFEDSNFEMLAREKVKFPEYKPYFRGLFVDHEGYLLVETSEDAAEDDDAVYDVFSPQGEFIGRVEMLRLRRSTVIKDGFVYMTKTPDDELPTVIRYRAEPTAEPISP